MISVCMATYNGEKYIRDQLQSILTQLSENDEVIISDDSSTDQTINIIQDLNDDRIILLENQKFNSPIYNFENALKFASGDIIFLSDQDDIWKAGKVKIMKNYIKNYNLVLSDAEIIDGEGRILEESFYKINRSKGGIIRNIVKNSYLGCTMAFNRKILNKILPFPKDLPMHDWWIGLISEMYGKVYFLEDKLISYRRHENNATKTGSKSNYNLFQKIKFRYILFKNLFIKKIKKSN